jgi:hypothetical protein
MTEDDFVNKLQLLTRPSSDDPEYELHMDESGRLIEALKWDASEKSKKRTGKNWDSETAAEVYTQFEWLHNQP